MSARRCDRHALCIACHDERVELAEANKDLLAALKYIVQWKPGDWSAEKALDMARAAIAKAEGRS